MNRLFLSLIVPCKTGESTFLQSFILVGDFAWFLYSNKDNGSEIRILTCKMVSTISSLLFECKHSKFRLHLEHVCLANEAIQFFISKVIIFASDIDEINVKNQIEYLLLLGMTSNFQLSSFNFFNQYDNENVVISASFSQRKDVDQNRAQRTEISVHSNSLF